MNSFNPNFSIKSRFNKRKNLRLQDFDYFSPGYYFVTICVKNRECLFGQIVNEKMVLNDLGRIVDFCWNDLLNHYKNCKLDQYVIMPNHIHGIIIINTVGEGLKPSPTAINNTRLHGLTEIIRGFKTFSSRGINEYRKKSESIWQRSFYDHVVRNEDDLIRIRQYIFDNIFNWQEDENYNK